MHRTSSAPSNPNQPIHIYMSMTIVHVLLSEILSTANILLIAYEI